MGVKENVKEIKIWGGVGILSLHIAVTQLPGCPQLEDHRYLIISYAIDE